MASIYDLQRTQSQIVRDMPHYTPLYYKHCTYLVLQTGVLSTCTLILVLFFHAHNTQAVLKTFTQHHAHVTGASGAMPGVAEQAGYLHCIIM